jgi:Ser-tRNA(Ala) deacylase AlaX
MEKLIVEAKVPEKKEGDKVVRKQIGPIQISVETGSTAAEMIQMFGEKAVKSNADANWRVTIQSNIRARLLKGETAEQIQAALGTAKMGVAVAGAKVDPIQAYLALFATASPEKQKEMLKELQTKAAAK